MPWVISVEHFGLHINMLLPRCCLSLSVTKPLHMALWQGTFATVCLWKHCAQIKGEPFNHNVPLVETYPKHCGGLCASAEVFRLDVSWCYGFIGKEEKSPPARTLGRSHMISTMISLGIMESSHSLVSQLLCEICQKRGHSTALAWCPCFDYNNSSFFMKDSGFSTMSTTVSALRGPGKGLQGWGEPGGQSCRSVVRAVLDQGLDIIPLPEHPLAQWCQLNRDSITQSQWDSALWLDDGFDGRGEERLVSEGSEAAFQTMMDTFAAKAWWQSWLHSEPSHAL